MILCGICAMIALSALMVISLFGASWITGKSIGHVICEIKNSIFYNLIGVEGVIDDYLSRKINKIEPITKSGKIAVITGGNRGIGQEVIKLLMQCDMKVIMGCRKVSEGKKVEKIVRDSGIKQGEIIIYQLDTSSLSSVKEFAAIIKQNYTYINYLINNAGIMFAPYKESVDGFESQFATNYLGHFLLTHLLLPLLKCGGNKDENARVVNVSSCAYTAGSIDFTDINHKKQFVSFEAYSQSKLAQIYFTTQLNKLFFADEGTNVQVHSVHPGVVNTGLFELSSLKKYAQWFMDLIFKKPIEGAYPIVYATISPKLEKECAPYITNCRVEKLRRNARNSMVEKKLFHFTNELLNIEEFGKDI